VGHSTLELEAFLARLGAHGIEHVADVRRLPRSRRHPHFTGAALAAELARARIGYSHHPGLGGMRVPRADSENRALREEAFRGYADHMGSAEFEQALDEVVARARGIRVAILCAEADPAHCHRRLIADLLAARGASVLHIRGTGPAEPHRISPVARASGGRVTYPAPDLFGADPTGG
jgi:uncharacterized protein (DUF488 family)